MKKNKATPIILILLLVSISLVFSGTTDASSDHVLMFYPRAATYGQQNAIELSTQKDHLSSNITDPLVFTASADEDNLVIFRLYDTLDDMFSKIPAYAGYTYNDYPNYVNYATNDKMFQTTNSVRIKIHTTGIFTSLENPEITRDFSLSCIMNEAHFNNSTNNYTLCKYLNMSPSDTVYNLTDGFSTTYFKSLGGGDYELYVPGTPTISNSNKYFPLYTRLFDICIVLNDDDDSLEEGYYSTTITIESIETYTNRLWTGNTIQSSNSTRIENTTATMKMMETITVYGQYGQETSTESGEFSSVYSFSVSPATDTFSMNLGDSSTYYNVAKVDFYSISRSNTKPATTNNVKYKVYVSSENSYTSSGTYQFTKKGTVKTGDDPYIEYGLYLQKSDGSYVAPANVTSNTTFPESTAIGSVGVSGTLYSLVPKYTLVTDTIYQNNNKITTYTETWSLSDLYLYLKVNPDNQSHTAGQYNSALYFTLVVN